MTKNPVSNFLRWAASLLEVKHPRNWEKHINPAQVKEFERSLQEVATWCAVKITEGTKSEQSQVGNHPARYWTPDLDPKIPLDDVVISIAQITTALRDVQEKRRKILSKRGVSVDSIKLKGRLLSTHFQWCTMDCAPESLTDGFFSGLDFPPWDTWVWLLQRDNPKNPNSPYAELLCWIPEEWCEMVNEAADASSDRTLQWLSNLEGPNPIELLKLSGTKAVPPIE